MAARAYASLYWRYFVVALIAVVTLTVAVVWVAFALLRPTRPRTVAMATDPEGSISAGLGKRYQERLARDGIELRLMPSVGAVENVARLRDPKSGISIGIIASGITNQQRSPDRVSLGTLFYKPLDDHWARIDPQRTAKSMAESIHGAADQNPDAPRRGVSRCPV